MCYNATYGSVTTEDDLTACKYTGTTFFVGAYSTSNPDVALLGAYGSGSIFASTNTGSSGSKGGSNNNNNGYSTAVYDSVYGVFWYHIPNTAFGFTDTYGINVQSGCDSQGDDCSSRLCWPVNGMSSGYRAGCTTNLNSSSYHKVIFVIRNTHAPTSSPTAGIKYNYPLSQITGVGYVKCYDEPYGVATRESDLSICKSSGDDYFVGTVDSSMSSVAILGAFGGKSIFNPTMNTQLAVKDPEYDVYWYHRPNTYFGFSEYANIDIANSCDAGASSYPCDSRLCWSVDGSGAGYRSGCQVPLLNMNYRKVIYARNDTYGIQHNMPVSVLTANNYKICYNKYYANSTTSGDLNECLTYGISYFVGVVSSADVNTIIVGAYGSSNIFTNTNSASTAVLDASYGVYWYRTSTAFGFTDNANILLNSCDTYDNQNQSSSCSGRVCWKLDAGVGGSRAACVQNLDNDVTYRKVMYAKVTGAFLLCNHAYTRNSQVCKKSAVAAPVLLPTIMPTVQGTVPVTV